jgi:hypothetical protein
VRWSTNRIPVQGTSRRLIVRIALLALMSAVIAATAAFAETGVLARAHGSSRE